MLLFYIEIANNVRKLYRKRRRRKRVWEKGCHKLILLWGSMATTRMKNVWAQTFKRNFCP
jgi:hypothetical protein